jgi:hypothetical protein
MDGVKYVDGGLLFNNGICVAELQVRWKGDSASSSFLLWLGTGAIA